MWRKEGEISWGAWVPFDLDSSALDYAREFAVDKELWDKLWASEYGKQL